MHVRLKERGGKVKEKNNYLTVNYRKTWRFATHRCMYTANNCDFQLANFREDFSIGAIITRLVEGRAARGTSETNGRVTLSDSANIRDHLQILGQRYETIARRDCVSIGSSKLEFGFYIH